jgi:hypothetical protein
MNKWAKGVLTPIAFVAGTAGGILKGVGKVVIALGDTIQHTLSGGTESVCELWTDDDENKQKKTQDA